MRYDRLFTKLFRTPLLLESNTRAGFEAALFSMMQGQLPELPDFVGESPTRDPDAFSRISGPRANAIRFDARKQNPDSGKKRMGWLLETGFGSSGRSAIIHVDGVIDKHLSAWEAACFDATDLNDFDRAMAEATNDPGIDNVLLYFNTPGGSVTGVPESAAKIAALCKKKNCFSFSDGMCCSAGFWLASQCDQTFCTASAQMGSIGVYLAILDASRYLEASGQKIETIKDGKLKAAGAYWKPLNDDERAHFQSQVDQIGAMFRADVCEKRGAVAADIMQGQAFMGKAALDAGLVDAILPDLQAALAQFER